MLGNRSCKAMTAVIAVLALVSCDKPAPPAAPPPPVTVARPLAQDVETFDEFTGTTEAVESAEIRARVPGFLQSIEFEPSSKVEKGDLLFVIEPAEYEAAVEMAEASLSKAKAEYEEAKWNSDRLEDLFKREVAAEKEVVEARMKLALTKAGVEAADAELTKAQLDLDYTQVRSPIDGMVGRNLVDVGNLVGAGEHTLLANVNRMDPIHAYYEANERLVLEHLAREKQYESLEDNPNRRAFLGLADEKGYPHEGVLDYVDNTVDPGSGTITLRSAFPNPDGRLFPGLFARIRMPAGRIDGALLVSECALASDQGGRYLLIVSDKNIVEQRPVEVGPAVGQRRVILSGVSADDWVVVNGLQRARPGRKVTPERVDMMPPVP